MYNLVASDDRLPNEYFSQDIRVEDAVDIHQAVADISSGGDERKARMMSDIIERRIRLAKTLTNMSLSLNHGAKRETIIEDYGANAGTVQKLLTDMVRAGVLERGALGFYNIKPEYWVSEQPTYDRTQRKTRAVMHENIKERELLEKLGGSGKFKTKLRLQKAMALAGVISNEHTIIPYCARAPDILELRRIFGEDITEGQNKGDLDALGKLTGKQCEPLIERYHPPGTTGVFFKIASKYA